MVNNRSRSVGYLVFYKSSLKDTTFPFILGVTAVNNLLNEFTGCTRREHDKKKKKKTRIVFCTYLIVLHCSYSTCQRSNRNVWLTAKSTTVTFFYVIQFCSKFCKKSTYQWSLALRVKMYCNTLCSCRWKNKLILLSFLILYRKFWTCFGKPASSNSIKCEHKVLYSPHMHDVFHL